ncbi:PREDICTED: uncharacterized protein LOC105366264 [Ceratosolen solmsi marchali]|uniref:Uncharacterized protein LOC105366264 n=1 Tax=Ceratosolen solmsi marchali TaxID=326594 RepID=A0AAJ7E0A4_9HYME|nr:PREDICTED: uncharacterized protein LOC105366264 [Ceratosolen solmsi marchali]
MSMNGRKPKMALVALRPVPDCPEPQDSIAASGQEFPPPPEEAERIISTLLPMVSPENSSTRSGHCHRHRLQQQQQRNIGHQWINVKDDFKCQGHAVTTQTTLPKTRHQRPYGWESNNLTISDGHVVKSFQLTDQPSPLNKFASLPYDVKVSFNWIAPHLDLEAKHPRANVFEDLRKSSEDVHENLRQSSEDGLEEEDEAGDDGDDDDEEEEEDVEEYQEEEEDEEKEEMDETEKASRRHLRSQKQKTVAACNSHHNHYHHHHHAGSRRPIRQTVIIKSSSVEDRLLMNNYQQTRGAEASGCPEYNTRIQNDLLDSSRRRRNNSDSSESHFSRNSESERSSMLRSSSISVEHFSVRANCDSSDFSRGNSTSNERFHSDFSIAVASASSNDHVSIPSSEPLAVRNLDFVTFGLPHVDSSERFSGQTSDRCSEEHYSEVYSTRNSDFSARNSVDFRTQSEEEHFSDDSLEELLPPPPTLNKRHSIAWEVTLDDEALYAPGSTKVVGRRRRKSSDLSSFGSTSKFPDFDDWQDLRVSTTDDDLISPYSDSSTNDLEQLHPQERSKNGTYVIRRGRKKERKLLPKLSNKGLEDKPADRKLMGSRQFSNTFDNIKSLLKESSKLGSLSEPPAELTSNTQAVSQPDLGSLEFEVLSAVPIVKQLTSTLQITNFAGNSQKSNDLNAIDTTNSLDASRAVIVVVDKLPTCHFIKEQQHLESKIPVNLLIEDQIVKKALNENRRQLEKVSDAIKEIESVKNSGEYGESNRWRSSELKNSELQRNSFEDDGCERQFLNVNVHDSIVHANGAIEGVRTVTITNNDHEFNRKRINEVDIYASGRRPRVSDLENHKNDTKQIENVIDAILEDSKNPDFQVSVEVLEFPPLPPSPVEEADEESSDIVSSGCNGAEATNKRTTLITEKETEMMSGMTTIPSKPKQSSHTNRTIEYRPRVPPHRGISFDSSKDHQTTSLNTRSMDAGYGRGRRTAAGIANARREVPVERRTLPTDLPGPSLRRPFTKRQTSSTDACSSGCNVNVGGGLSGGGSGNGGGNIVTTGSAMQTSCSLPETPVFARGNDIPRTPQHTVGNPTQPRRQPGWYAPTTATTGYRRNNPGLEQAIIGTELLRLAGGPNRGWYPTRKSNQPRPASIEHLERLNCAYDPRLLGASEQRKPLTLPTNITPNKYFGQSKHSSASSTREALRRVTSLLIKKGGGNKDGKNSKDNLSPSGPYAVVPGIETNDAPKKKGFFKNFWKRSRHYSLENQ